MKKVRPQSSTTLLWHLQMEMNWNGNEYQLSLIKTEEAMLTMFREIYLSMEKQFVEMLRMPIQQRPAGMVEGALRLNRCLVFGRLEVIDSKFVKLKPTNS